MKLRVNKDTVTLTVPTTSKELKTYEVPKEGIHFWYPFNVNFHYKYSDSKRFIYLIKEKDYEGENLYGVDILKRTKPLGEHNGVMLHPRVYERNQYILGRAKGLGIPTLEDQFTLRDVQEGFSRLGDLIQAVKTRVESRVELELELESELGGEETLLKSEFLDEEWDTYVYSNMTSQEEEVLLEFGEMCTMLTIMRKLAESERG